MNKAVLIGQPTVVCALDVEKALIHDLGFTAVWNPVKTASGFSSTVRVLSGLPALLVADLAVLLPGWETRRSSRWEALIARMLRWVTRLVVVDMHEVVQLTNTWERSAKDVTHAITRPHSLKGRLLLREAREKSKTRVAMPSMARTYDVLRAVKGNNNNGKRRSGQSGGDDNGPRQAYGRGTAGSTRTWPGQKGPRS